ncbi:hypothetical protein EON64_12575, partial [archaeon]
MIFGRPLFIALLSVLAVVNASLRDIPIQPKYIKNYNAQHPSQDGPDFYPNYVVENYAGTRDARTNGLDLDADAIALIGTDVDYASFTDNGYTAISGGNGVSANEAKFTGVFGLGYHYSSHSLYITDYCVIRRVDANGIVTVYAGSYFDTYRTTYYDDVFIQQLGQSCGFNDDVPAISAMFSYPYSLAVDESNNVYVADTENMRIRKISDSGIVSTVIGFGNHGGNKLAAGGVAKDAYIGHVVSMTYASNNIYFHFVDFVPADLHGSLWAVNLNTGLLSTMTGFIGSAVPGNSYGSMFASAPNANLYMTYAYEEDDGRHSGIFVIPFDGGAITTLAKAPALDFSPSDPYANSDYLSVTGDLYGNLFYFVQYDSYKYGASGIIGYDRKCAIYMVRKDDNQHYMVGGGGNCGASTVGSPSMDSRIMPGYYMVINKYDDILWAQHYQEAYADKTFYTAGVMSLTLAQPTSVPTSQPSQQPSSRPSTQPTSQPSMQPSSRPTTQPTSQPS